MRSSRRVIALLAKLAVLAALIGATLPVGPATADEPPPRRVLFYGPTAGGLAQATPGTEATVWNEETWSSKTRADFAAFDAIVFGDQPVCFTDPSRWNTAVANRDVWSGAVTGNIMIIGSDPDYHNKTQLVQQSVTWAANGRGTGLYISLSCAFHDDASGQVGILGGLGAFTVTGAQQHGGCPNQAYKLSNNPAVDGLDNAYLSNWGCSAHEGFDSWPANYSPLVMITDATTAPFTASDGTSGLVYIIASSSDLRITVDEPTINASPAFMNLQDAGLQANSPSSTQGAPLNAGTIIGTPLNAGTIIGTPLNAGTIIGTPLNAGTIIGTPLNAGTIIGTPLLLSSLGSISLAQLPLDPTKFPGGWGYILEGTALQGVPDTNISLRQPFELSPTPARLSSITFGDIDWKASPLGASISTFGVATLGIKLKDVTLPATSTGFCTILENLGKPNCGSDVGGLEAQPLGLEAAGLSLAPFGLAAVNLNSINLTNALFLNIKLATIRDSVGLNTTPWGAVRIADIPNPDSVVNCRPICSDNEILANVASSIKATATIRELGQTVSGRWLPIPPVGALSLGQVAMSFSLLGDYPIESIPLETLTRGYTGDGSNLVHYHVSYTYRGTTAVDRPSLSVRLPATFRYVPGSSGLKRDGAPVAQPLGDPTVDGSQLTWSLTETSLVNGSSFKLIFQALPGLKLGKFATSATLTGPGLTESSGEQASVTVIENFESAGLESGGIPTLQSTRTYFPHHGTPGDMDLFRFVLPADTAGVPTAGTKVSVLLSHLSNDADLVVYFDSNAPATQAVRAAPLNAGTIIGTPLNAGTIIGTPIQDDKLSIDNTARDSAPQALQDISLLDQPVAGYSANRSLSTEQVDIIVPPNMPVGSAITIQTSAYNGSSSDLAHMLRVKTQGAVPTPPCAPRAFAYPNVGSAGTLPASIPAGTKTLFLTNWARFGKSYGLTATDDLKVSVTALAARAEVAGVVIPVEGSSEVSSAYNAWDANPCSAELANNVARSINGAADSLLQVNKPAIENIVIVGSDEIVPFVRSRDRTWILNESTFSDDLAFSTTTTVNTTPRSNALMGSAAQGYVLTDDGYFDFNPIDWLSEALYLPDVSGGRLVETPSEITGQIGRYNTFGGKLDPQTAVAAGYDFNKDQVTEQKSRNISRLGSANSFDLINDTWTVSDLKSKFYKDLVFPQGHANQFAFLGAAGNSNPDLSDTILTGDINAAGAPKLTRAIVSTIACHFGLNVSDVIIGAAATDLTPGQRAQYLDWAQALGKQEAAVVGANSGYGYGDIVEVAYSERLVNLFHERLQKGAKAGDAFRWAKHAYWGTLNARSVFDKKALEEFIFFGLPFFKLDGAAVTPPDLPSAPATLAYGTDTGTGLPIATTTINPSYSKVDTPVGSFYKADGQSPQVTNYRPVTSSTGLDITRTGLVPTGALITGATQLSDISGFDPAISNPTPDLSKLSPEPQIDDLAFPSTVQTISSYLSPSGPKDRLNLMVSRFRGTGVVGGKEVGVLGRFGSLNTKVFYGTPGTTDELKLTIAKVTTKKLTGSVQVDVDVSDATSSDPTDTAGVLALVRDGSTWKPGYLTRSSGDHWSGAVAISSTNTEVWIQAWTNKGFVSQSTNKATFFGDATPPRVTINSPLEGQKVKLGQIVKASFSCSDGGAGLDSCEGTVPSGTPIDTTHPGANVFRVIASDRAGNTVVEERTYYVVYGWTGFLSPVQYTDNPSGGINSVRSGQAIPLKWQLFDSSGVSYPGLTADDATLKWTAISCDPSRTESELNVGIVTLGVGLKYDPVNQQYIWVIDTPKTGWSGLCRRLYLSLNDGSSHFADFAFK